MADRLWYDERLLIDGQLVPASGGATFENVNPATEEVIGVVADGSLADMDNAIGAARRAFDTTGWSTDEAFRLRCIRQLQEAFTRHLEEIFGPVLVVIAHDGDDDAVDIANDSVYGLSGAVISDDIERARRVAKRVRTGTIGVNGGLFYSPDVPFGGYRQSGIGREMGVAGFEEYLETKSIAEGA